MNKHLSTFLIILDVGLLLGADRCSKQCDQCAKGELPKEVCDALYAAGTCPKPPDPCDPAKAPGPVCSDTLKVDCWTFTTNGGWTFVEAKNCSEKICPIGQQCAETVEGPTCYTPKPDPEPKCDREKGENCDCWVKLEVTDDWRKMSCSTPETCVNKHCTAPEEPPTVGCANVCPKDLAPGASLFMRNKKYAWTPRNSMPRRSRTAR